MSKRVLMIATVPSMIGQFNMNNIRILQGLGYEVDVASDFTDVSVWPAERVQKFKDQLNDMGIEAIQLDFSRSPLKIGRHIESYKQTVKLIKDRGYAFIHTHTPIASAIVRQAAHKTGTKVIYTAHGFHFYDGAPLKNWLIFYPIEKWFSHYTDVLITINKEDYKRASEKFKAKKVVYIPGVGVDTEKFAICKVDKIAKRAELGIPKDCFLVMSVGELNSNKNHSVIIRALGTLKDDNVHFAIAGEGTLKEKLLELADMEGVGSNVHLLGYRKDIAELYKAADVCSFTSIREGLGLAGIEGMAAGLPLIVSNNRGTRSFASQDGTRICKFDDIKGFAYAIRELELSNNLRSSMGNRNIVKSREFDIETVNQIMSKVYEAFSD